MRLREKAILSCMVNQKAKYLGKKIEIYGNCVVTKDKLMQVE